MCYNEVYLFHALQSAVKQRETISKTLNLSGFA